MTTAPFPLSPIEPVPQLNIFAAAPLPPGVPDLLARLHQTPGITHIAIMPDVHLAAEFCVGAVIASPSLLFPNAVGGDIGCGILAIQFDAPADLLADAERAARLLAALQTLCPARRRHRNTAPSLPDQLRDQTLSHPHLTAALHSEDSRLQLGTLGAGNHFLELQSDDSGRLWLMLHTGSRHLGQLIHHHHLAHTHKTRTHLLALHADSPAGQAYLADVQLARRYAAANRRTLALATVRALEQTLHITPLLDTLLDVDHNHLQPESHPLLSSQPLFLHRKGATPAHQNQPGLIPGSMATTSYHTTGKGHAPALCSSSHGAGRALSRTQARQKITPSALRSQLAAAHVWYDPRLTRSLIEEAPAAYKNIRDVMHAQQSLTTITRTLKPLLLHKST
jgi:tRNA-splicing ligase RtcB